METIITGIDVSEFNGTLDWAKLRAAGVGFAIIRSGFGTSHEDAQFQANVRGCIANGIPFGIYHFSYALSVEGAIREADYCMQLLKPYRGQIALPVFYDLEYDTIRYANERGVTLDRQDATAHTLAFCHRMELGGYRAGTYFNPDYRSRMLDLNALSGFSTWFAHWESNADWSGYDVWQYTSELLIAGHSCHFDGNRTTARWLQECTGQAAAEEDTTEESPETITARAWVNGSTREPVYADTARATRVGSLNPFETCTCLGTVDGMYLVQYTVDATGATKVGLVDYAG